MREQKNDSVISATTDNNNTNTNHIIQQDESATQVQHSSQEGMIYIDIIQRFAL